MAEAAAGGESHWNMCGSGSGAPKKCRFLWLTVLFLCPALCLT